MKLKDLKKLIKEVIKEQAGSSVPMKKILPAYVCNKCGGATEISLPNLLEEYGGSIEGPAAFFPCLSPSQNEICEEAWGYLNPGIPAIGDVSYAGEPVNWILYNPPESDMVVYGEISIVNPSVEEWGNFWCNPPVDTQGVSLEDFCVKCAAGSWPQEILDGECIEIQDCCPSSGGISIDKKPLDKKPLQEKPGLWANIRAKRKRVGKKGMAKKGSKAYKSAKKAGDKINKKSNEGHGLNESDLQKIKKIIKKTLEKEGGASGLKPLKKATSMSTKDLEQTLDKMGNVKKHKHDDYILTPIEEDIYEGGCMEEDMYEGGCMEEEYEDMAYTDTLEEVYIVESEDEIQMIEDALNEEEEVEEGRKKKKCKPSKGKRFAKRVDGKCRSFGQKGKASDGGDRIRPGTKKAHAYCARSAKIKKCKNPPCANTLSRKKWKCQGSRSVPESIQERFQKLANIIK